MLGDTKELSVYPPSQAGCPGGVQSSVAREVGDDAGHSPSHYHQIMPGLCCACECVGIRGGELSECLYNPFPPLAITFSVSHTFPANKDKKKGT